MAYLPLASPNPPPIGCIHSGSTLKEVLNEVLDHLFDIARPRSSVEKSIGFLNRVSEVRFLPGAPIGVFGFA